MHLYFYSDVRFEFFTFLDYVLNFAFLTFELLIFVYFLVLTVTD